MRVVPSLVQEFDELCARYNNAADQTGKDIVVLVTMFGNANDHLRDEPEPDYGAAWAKFLNEHRHEVSVFPTCGLVLNMLVTYWDLGTRLFESLPTLEKMLVRDIVFEIDDEIRRRSAENSNLVLSVE